MKMKKFIAAIGKIAVAGAFAVAAVAGGADCAAAAGATDTEIMQALFQEGGAVYPVGKPNDGYAKYFTGRSFLYPIANDGVNVANVTFEPGCINFWHKHHGSCQVLAAVSGKGYYQIWGEEPKELLPGQSVTIPEGVKHWHGAQHTSWFQHLSIMKSGADTEWLEPVSASDYAKLK